MGASDGAADGNPTIDSISTDGRYLHASSSTIAGTTLNRRYFLFDRVTGTDIVSRTVSEQFPGGTLRVSNDLEWGVYITVPPDPAPAVRRKNFATGQNDVVPIDPARLSSYSVFDGSHVVAAADPSADDPAAPHLYVWEGDGPMVMLTIPRRAPSTSSSTPPPRHRAGGFVRRPSPGRSGSPTPAVLASEPTGRRPDRATRPVRRRGSLASSVRSSD